MTAFMSLKQLLRLKFTNFNCEVHSVVDSSLATLESLKPETYNQYVQKDH